MAMSVLSFFFNFSGTRIIKYNSLDSHSVKWQTLVIHNEKEMSGLP